VGEDQTILVLVNLQELHLQVLRSIIVAVVAFVLREADIEPNLADFFGEQVNLVHKENNRGVLEVTVIDNVVKHADGLVDTVFLFILVQTLIVFRYGRHENHSSNAFKAMNPLSSLVALATDIQELEVNIVDLERSLHDTTYS